MGDIMMSLIKVCNRLWDVEGSLKGLGGLLTLETRDFCLEDGEVFGIGQLLKVSPMKFHA